MLKLIFFVFFMIPFIMNYWIMSTMISILILIFIMFFNKNLYMISYMLQIG